jgi:ankyrin repeat protein
LTPYEQLLKAAESGDVTSANAAIAAGADVNAKDTAGWTPLHEVAIGAHTVLAKLLVDKGADINARDEDGWTPLHEAARDGHMALARLLIDNGANVTAKDIAGSTPRQVATIQDHTVIADLLKEAEQKQGKGFAVRVPGPNDAHAESATVRKADPGLPGQ